MVRAKQNVGGDGYPVLRVDDHVLGVEIQQTKARMLVEGFNSDSPELLPQPPHDVTLFDHLRSQRPGRRGVEIKFGWRAGSAAFHRAPICCTLTHLFSFLKPEGKRSWDRECYQRSPI